MPEEARGVKEAYIQPARTVTGTKAGTGRSELILGSSLLFAAWPESLNRYGEAV